MQCLRARGGGPKGGHRGLPAACCPPARSRARAAGSRSSRGDTKLLEPQGPIKLGNLGIFTNAAREAGGAFRKRRRTAALQTGDRNARVPRGEAGRDGMRCLSAYHPGARLPVPLCWHTGRAQRPIGMGVVCWRCLWRCLLRKHVAVVRGTAPRVSPEAARPSCSLRHPGAILAREVRGAGGVH